MTKQSWMWLALGAAGLLAAGARAEQPPAAGGGSSQSAPSARSAASVPSEEEEEEKGLQAAIQRLDEQLIAALKLANKQDAPVRKILENHRGDLLAWFRKTAPEAAALRERIRLFHQGQDKEDPSTAKAAADRLRELEAQRLEKIRSVLVPLKDVLDEGQLARARQTIDPAPQVPRPAPPFHLLDRLELTPAQRARAKEILGAAEVKAAHQRPDANSDPREEAWDQIVKQVLSEKDRQRLEEVKKASHRRVIRAMFGGADLSEEQFARIDEILEEARKKAEENPQDWTDIFQEAHNRIVEKVLTPPQRQQIREKQAAGQGQDPHGQPGGGRGGPLPAGNVPLK